MFTWAYICFLDAQVRTECRFLGSGPGRGFSIFPKESAFPDIFRVHEEELIVDTYAGWESDTPMARLFVARAGEASSWALGLVNDLRLGVGTCHLLRVQM